MYKSTSLHNHPGEATTILSAVPYGVKDAQLLHRGRFASYIHRTSNVIPRFGQCNLNDRYMGATRLRLALGALNDVSFRTGTRQGLDGLDRTSNLHT